MPNFNARCVLQGGVEVWRRELSGNRWAVAVLNRNDEWTPQRVSFSLRDDFHLPPPTPSPTPADLWDAFEGFTGTLLGTYAASNRFACLVNPNGVFLVLFAPHTTNTTTGQSEGMGMHIAGNGLRMGASEPEKVVGGTARKAVGENAGMASSKNGKGASGLEVSERNGIRGNKEIGLNKWIGNGWRIGSGAAPVPPSPLLNRKNIKGSPRMNENSANML